MSLDVASIPSLATEYASKSPQDILALALGHYSPAVAISFSGAEDVVLIDMASKLGIDFKVFSLDTGRLHPETYRFLERTRNFENFDRIFRPRRAFPSRPARLRLISLSKNHSNATRQSQSESPVR